MGTILSLAISAAAGRTGGGATAVGLTAGLGGARGATGSGAFSGVGVGVGVGAGTVRRNDLECLSCYNTCALSLTRSRSEQPTFDFTQVRQNVFFQNSPVLS